MGSDLIILCGTQRCGSTMIVADFRETLNLGKPEEYFIPWTTVNIEEPLENYENIINQSMSENGVSSIKIMANQLPFIESQLVKSNKIQLLESECEYLFPHVKKLLDGAAFIKINRLDTVAQAVSRVMSRKTGKNHFISKSSTFIPGNNTFDNTNYNDSVIYDVDEINKEVISISKENTLWDLVLDNWNPRQRSQLIYEDCVNSYSYLNVLGDLLSVSIDINMLPPRKIKKIGNVNNDVFIKKYLSDNTSDNTLSNIEINLIRDTAISIENYNVKHSLLLMNISSRLRPDGQFMKNKISEYKTIIKNNS